MRDTLPRDRHKMARGRFRCQLALSRFPISVGGNAVTADGCGNSFPICDKFAPRAFSISRLAGLRTDRLLPCEFSGRIANKGSVHPRSETQSVLGPEMHGDDRSNVAREATQKSVEQLRRAELAAAINLLPEMTVEVLRESLTGATVYAISRRLGVATRTVKRHRARMLKAIGVRTLVEAASVLAGAGVEIPPQFGMRERSDQRAA